ncbi:MAG: redoxin domain-containing protein [Pseudomonadota bacterium]
MSQLLPGQPFPALDLPRVGGGRLTNADFDGSAMTVLNVYRGLHCPRCKAQLEDFVAHRLEMDAAGIKIVSISTDPQDRAEQAVTEWGLGDMAIGYDLTVAGARDLGLFISEAIREGETAFFAEAAVFMIGSDGVLWGSSVNTFPFMRPTAAMILDAAETRRARNYPPRGNVAA